MTDLVSAGCENTSSPSPSETDSTPRGVLNPPPDGKIENAAVRSSGVTTPVPSASDGTSGKSRRPESDARCRTAFDEMRC